jgi:hypothetical protein
MDSIGPPLSLAFLRYLKCSLLPTYIYFKYIYVCYVNTSIQEWLQLCIVFYLLLRKKTLYADKFVKHDDLNYYSKHYKYAFEG